MGEVKALRSVSILQLQQISDHLAEIACPYPSDERPVFFGHYWLSGELKPFSTNVACLDYSVAKDGHLCAYQWCGEQKLEPAWIVTVGG